MAPTNTPQKKYPGLGWLLLTTFCCMLIGHVYLPSWRLTFFAPWIIIIYYRKSYLTALWASLFCGSVIDLLSSENSFGLYALNYTLVTAFLYGNKRNFFADHLSTLPIMTFFFSILSTLIQITLLYGFEDGIVISWKWVATDLIILPLCDAGYALICFALPLLFLKPQHETENI